MDAPSLIEPAGAVRAFNRFYTRRIGVLDEGLAHSEFSLTEARVLWELAHQPQLSAVELSRELRLDGGYLSRLLRGLRERGLIKARANPADARQSLLSLTAAGRRAFAPLEQGSQMKTAEMLGKLNSAQQARLLRAMSEVQHLLEGRPTASPRLRALVPGDLGWVVSRHGALYAREFGWDLSFEAMVARIAAQFVEQRQPHRERGWIAEHEDGEDQRLGCVFLVQARDEQGTERPGVAQLRLLLVEPEARGLGLGRQLVRACTAFAREAGYRQITLWTNSLLAAARGIYQAEGYRLTHSEPHHSFGHDQLAETWELDLK